MKVTGRKVWYISLLCAATVMASCTNEWEEAFISDTGDAGTLVVSTRAGGTEDDAVSYPVLVYVFDESDACVAVDDISEGETEVTFTLTEGVYTVCAIGGASEEHYDMPSEEDATPESVIELWEGAGYTDLMTATEELTVTTDEADSLTAELIRRVVLLQSVTMEGVPEDIVGVDMTFSPLYGGLQLDGEYSEKDGEHTISLVQNDEDASVWEDAAEEYMPGSSDSVVITVCFLWEDGVTTSYAYTYPEAFEANHKINVFCTYTGESVRVTGKITAEDWAGDETIEFEFGEGDEAGVSDTSVPDVGDIYEGAFIWKVEEATDGGYTVSMMSAATDSIFVSLANDSLKAVATAKITASVAELISAQETSDGRTVGSLEDMEYIYDHFDDLNERLDAQGCDVFVRGETSTKSAYLYLSDTGEWERFYMYDGYGGGVTSTMYWGMGTYVRIFKDITFQ